MQAEIRMMQMANDMIGTLRHKIEEGAFATVKTVRELIPKLPSVIAEFEAGAFVVRLHDGHGRTRKRDVAII